MKMTMMMPGWSAHGGQTLSPYVGKIKENEKILGHSVSRRAYRYYSLCSSQTGPGGLIHWFCGRCSRWV